MYNQGMKKCRKCDKAKPPEDFHKSPHYKDGRRPYCKECVRAENREWKAKNPERSAQHRRKWYEANKDKANAASDQWRRDNPEAFLARLRRSEARHPENVKARKALNNAVRDGKIHKPKHCEDCGELTASRYLHGHHHDYEKPLDVEWICNVCHGSRHTKAPSEI